MTQHYYYHFYVKVWCYDPWHILWRHHGVFHAWHTRFVFQREYFYPILDSIVTPKIEIQTIL